MVVDAREVRLPGITGVLRDGILPGLYGYEAGSAAAGDMLAWYVDTFAGDLRGARGRGGSTRPGETGLLALDWWNGNRSILADAGLTGVDRRTDPALHAGGDLPSAARVDRARQPADHGQLHRARARAERDRRLRRDRRAQPADHAAARRHQRAAGPRAVLERDTGARLGAVRRGRGGSLRRHRRGDCRDAPGDGADLHAGPLGPGGLRRRVRDLSGAVRDARSHPGGAAARTQAHPH